MENQISSNIGLESKDEVTSPKPTMVVKDNQFILSHHYSDQFSDKLITQNEKTKAFKTNSAGEGPDLLSDKCSRPESSAKEAIFEHINSLVLSFEKPCHIPRYDRGLFDDDKDDRFSFFNQEFSDAGTPQFSRHAPFAPLP